ncbi:MAG: hypothetical protein VYA55_12350 [Pseudomonadota bacterium]|nr:hypothetical protein [Pseudomonadota bacterium]
MTKVMKLPLVVVLLGCGIAPAMAAEKSSDADFLKSYKASFLESCIESSGGPQFKPVCECVLNDVVGRFPVPELKDDKAVSEYIEHVAMQKCEK